MTKIALLIGLNYTGSDYQLNGCINDVKDAQKELIKRGYIFSSVITDIIPITKEMILTAMGDIVIHAKSGDTIVIMFSGHGGQSRNKEEKDGWDECIYDSYFNKILDDEIRKETVGKLGPGINLYFHFDCCHSGTMVDLPFNYIIRESRALKKPDFWEEMLTYSRETYSGFHDELFSSKRGILSFFNIFKPSSGVTITQEHKEDVAPGSTVVMLSGCKDNQVSYDAYFKVGKDCYLRRSSSVANGAMSKHFWMILNSNPDITFYELLKQLNISLKKSRFDQKPQLSSNLNDMNIKAIKFWI